MIRVLLHGANGAMGRAIARLLEDGLEGCAPGPMVSRGGHGFYASIADVKKPADLVMDFSFHTATQSALRYASERGLPIVIGTTGHTEEELESIKKASERIPVFLSGNMSFGIAALCGLVREAARLFPEADIEIVETHHNRKADAPSGTALMLGRAIKKERPEADIVRGRAGFSPRKRNEISISSVRLGNITGIHEVFISTGTETLTLKHEAHDRLLFAQGALRAAAFLCGKQPGLYGMDDLLEGGVV